MIHIKVVIAEKPDIAKAVSAVIDGKPVWKDGYIEQGEYYLTWCYGHLLTLKDPEDYGDEYSRQNTPNDKLPIFFNNWGMKIAESGEALTKDGKKPPDKAKQLKTIGELLKKSSLVIIAGDIDDEGQLLVEEVLEWHNYNGNIKRLNTDALNEASLKKAMNNLMDNTEWHKKAVSARARSVADFALGINGSRFFSNTYKANLSVGRVQTVALGLVVNRDEQIESHNGLKYFLLDMDAAINNETYKVRFIPSENNPQLQDGRITNRPYLEKLGGGASGKTFTAKVSKEIIYENPPLPFSISALKTYCSDKYNLSPEETLQITQSLRMNHGGLITYNRSECRYLPENMHAEAPVIISAIQHNLGPKWMFPGLDNTVKSKAFNDKNITAHHAIIPTSTVADISKLSEKEQKVYRAICGYYMVQFMPPCSKERTRLTVEGKGGNIFETTSVKVISKGFKAVMNTDITDDTNKLSDLPSGEYQCILSNPEISEKETKPPKRYTDTSLENDMKSVAKYVTDEEIKKLLLLKDKDSKEEHGAIGTAATRSAIIKTLKKRNFLKNEGKQVVSTQLGRNFFKILSPELQNPELTAKWWVIQEAIKEDNASPEDMYKDVLDVYHRLSSRTYPEINLATLAAQGDRKELGKCPRCGNTIIESTKGFGCLGYKQGCKFVIWKEGKFGGHKILTANNKKLTATMVKSLLEKGKVLVRGLVSERTGKEYDAWIVLKDDGTYVNLELDFTDVPKKIKKKGDSK